MLERCVLFSFGGLGYGCIELLWRGHTHWTMLLAGGLGLLALAGLDGRLARWPFLVRCAAGAMALTGLELAAGLVCNRLLGWGVWDYSGQWGNLWGQICPRYTLLWFLLCLPVFAALGAARKLGQPGAAPGPPKLR